MPVLKSPLKFPILFLTFLLLPLHSCVVYHKTPSTLEQAAELPIRAKVTNVQGEQTKYRYIMLKDGAYYGVKKQSGEVVKIPLNAEELEKVQVKNKVASTWLTVGAIALPVAAVGFVALVATVFLLAG